MKHSQETISTAALRRATAIMSILCVILGVGLVHTFMRLVESNNMLESAPLRDDLRIKNVFETGHPIDKVNFIDEGAIAYGYAGHIYKMNLDEKSTWEELPIKDFEEIPARGDSLSHDGKLVLSYDSSSGELVIKEANSLRNGSERVNWLGSSLPPVTASSFSPDDKQLVTAHSDGIVRVWNVRSASERERLHWDGRMIGGICFSPNGCQILAFDSQSQEICLWGPVQWMK